MPSADDQPHTLTPKGVFDLCIERLGTSPGEPFYPVQTERWPGDERSWSEWKAFIESAYVSGKSSSDRNVRHAILLALHAEHPDKLPYYDFELKKVVKRDH